jgi:hypothetical protein
MLIHCLTRSLTILSVVLGYIVNGVMTPQPPPTRTMADAPASSAAAAPAARPVLNVSASTPSGTAQAPTHAGGLIPFSLRELALAVFHPQPSHLVTPAATQAGSSASASSDADCPHALSVRAASSLALVPKTPSSVALAKPSSSALSVVPEPSTSLSVLETTSSALSVVPAPPSSLALPLVTHTSLALHAVDPAPSMHRALGALSVPRARRNAKQIARRIQARLWPEDAAAAAVVDAIGTTVAELVRALDELADALRKHTRHAATALGELRAWAADGVGADRGGLHDAVCWGKGVAEGARQVLRARHRRARENARKLVGSVQRRARRGVGTLRSRAQARSARAARLWT